MKFALPDSTKSKQEFKIAVNVKTIAALFPRPLTMGSFAILITILAFAAGWLRNELALTLLGTVFLVILTYCFLGVFLLGLVYRKNGRSLSISISPDVLAAGDNVEICIKTNSGFPPGKNVFFKLPAILIRCELCLETKDGRVIRQYADPGKEKFCSFPVKKRGAYYSAGSSAKLLSGRGNSFIIIDAPCFFKISLPLDQNEGARLLAVPSPNEEPISLSLQSGGNEERLEAHYRKSDSFTDHRPYIPGDDPRRINWKLYSHAPLGDLFVREGEPEPPPHSRLLILVDTELDCSLYTANEGRNAIDMLCEIALAAALEYQNRGMDIHIGHTGCRSISGKEEPLNAAKLAAALALPFAIFRANNGVSKKTSRAELPKAEAEFPSAPNDAEILILALPRKFTESALERFLEKQEIKQALDIAFLYNAGAVNARELEDAATSCVNLFNGRSGIHAGKAEVKPKQKWEDRN